MSSRLMRLLLKLYPRRIRDRYGEELLDLQSELKARRDVSGPRLVWDMLAGALLVRPARQRAHLVIGVVLVTVGLAIAGTIIGEHGAGSPARAFHPQARLATEGPRAAPCFVAAGASCSLAPCSQFTGLRSTAGVVVPGLAPPTRRRLRATGTQCAAHAHARPPRTVFVRD